jgi:threonine synthase
MTETIKFYSTNLKAPKVSFGEALLQGLAPDRGLYMPEKIPVIEKDELNEYSKLSYADIALRVANKFLAGEMEDGELKRITSDAYNFSVPLENVTGRKFIMRLDQGPTASFKDFAARMMGRLMQYYLAKENKKLLILTATSGDTGSAIANAFYGLDNIKVIVLFPEKEVTERQRKQMTTLQKNIEIIAIDGKFDDCQALVKQAFSDHDLQHLQLSSANSINIGRLLPQSMYYVYAYSKLASDSNEQIVFSVPSGNFGNLMGGLIAMKMGLPVNQFVVVTNANNEVPVYWNTGNYMTITPSINCISSAMNVGHPSNIARVVALYGGVMNEKGIILQEPQLDRMRKDMYAVSISDAETRETIKDVYEKYGIILEPHGAVGWAGLMKKMKMENPVDHDQICVSLETAHPAKFPEEINRILGIDPELPDSLKGLDGKKEEYVFLDNNYEKFKKYLKNNHQ